MRTEFDKQLKKLHGDLLEMGTLCEDAITMTAQMLDGREGLTAKISAAEMEIDHKQREVESRLPPDSAAPAAGCLRFARDFHSS